MTSGEDNIFKELIKVGQEELNTPLTVLFNKILDTEQIPIQWKKSQIILLHKKGTRTNINNYRPISLISSICKIFTKMIQRRIKNNLEVFQDDEQADFRKNKSTIDHLHVVNQVLEKTNEYNISIYIAFVDSLKHEYIWNALQKTNVERKYIRVIKKLYLIPRKYFTSKIKQRM